MNINKLQSILQIQSASYDQFRMFARIIRELNALPECRFSVIDGNIYATKGHSKRYPCVVAHMDTVHDVVQDLTAVRIGNNFIGFNQATMTQSGIGGDDKVGVFIALESLRLFDNIKAVFFRDEEIGCDGSYLADLSFFDDCTFVLESDRQGDRDFIVEVGGIELSSPEFQMHLLSTLDSFDYQFASGMMTDVVALKERGVKCSVANISCGYFNPHTEFEFVNIDCVQHCLNLVSSIIQHFGDIAFPHLFQVDPGWKAVSEIENSHTLLCLDCWAQPATDTRYCQSCNAYYDLSIK